MRRLVMGGLGSAVLAACSLLAPNDGALLGAAGAGGAAGDGASNAAGGGTPSGASGSGSVANGGAAGAALGGAAGAGSGGALDGSDAGGVPSQCGPCQLPHAESRCEQGSCVIASCRAPWADTNQLPGDGCEAPTIPVEGLLVWLAADEGVTHDAGEVSAWADQSGNGHHAVAVDDGTPTLVERAGLPFPGVEFDGAGDALRLPELASFDGLGVYVVGEVFAGASCARILQLAEAGGGRLDVGRQGDAPYYGLDAASVMGAADELPSDMPFLFAVLHFRNNQASLRANGAFLQSGTFAYPVNRTFAENFVGFDAAGGCNLRGRIYELLIYDFPTNDERPQIESYLQAKWSCCTPPG